MKWERIAIPVLVLVGVAALLMSQSSGPGSKLPEQERVAPFSGGSPREASAQPAERRAAPPRPGPTGLVSPPAPVTRIPNPADRGLSWLVKAQKEDGRWEGKLRITGLALSAFFSHGETHKHGRHKRAVKNGLKLLKQVQGPDGAFAPLNIPDNIPDHVIATLAMCEAFALTSSPLFKNSAQLGLDATAKLLDEEECRKAYGISSMDIDPASAVWMAMSFRTARDAGLRVTEAAFPACRERVVAAYGSPRFPPASPAALEAGRLFAGLLLDCDPEKHPEMMATLSRLRSGPPAGADQSDSAYWLFGLSAVFVTDDQGAWKTWCRALDKVVLPLQRADGSFGGEGAQSWGLGEAGNTALYLTGLALRQSYPRYFKRAK